MVNERDIVVPFINHAATSPVVVFCQTISLLPSPLRSPVATIRQLFGMPIARYAPLDIVVPFI
ncbi:hypothetical protein MBAV_002998, partial [Candidatus Magnetobacterium bavaricum]